jgi:predicted metal-dependent hydrolase
MKNMAQNRAGTAPVQSRQITVDGIEMTLERRKMKNMYIHVLRPDGRVRVSVPRNVPEEAVNRFITDHMEWIRKNRDKYTAAERPAEFVSGETHYLWGVPCILEVREAAMQGRNITADAAAGRMIMLAEKGSTPQSRAAVMEKFYRSELQRRIPEVLGRCAAVTGKTPDEIHIRDMRTRWGTCNVKAGRIWLNLQLAKHTPECLDYVMTHELTHLYVSTHGPEFKAYMDRFYPDWRRVRKELNNEHTEPVSCSG